MLWVLDSTVLIDFLRGRPVTDRVLELRGRGDTPATTAINIEEIVRGLRSGEESAVQRLFDGLIQLSVDRRAAWLAGRWRREYASSGTTLSQEDCLIAAATHTAGATLATGNPTDFPMADIRVEHWPVGS
jgi:predicted nucleic acid-binding protein